MQNGLAKLLVGCVGITVTSLCTTIARTVCIECGSFYWQGVSWVTGFAALFWIGYAMASTSITCNRQQAFRKVILEICVPGWLLSLLIATLPFAVTFLLSGRLSFQEFACLALLCITTWAVGLVLGVFLRRPHSLLREFFDSAFRVWVSIMIAEDSS